MEHRDQLQGLYGTQGSDMGNKGNTGVKYRGYMEHRNEIQGI